LVAKLRAWLEGCGEVEPDEILFPISARAGVTVTRSDGTVYYRRQRNADSRKDSRQTLPPIPERKTHTMMRDDLAAARRIWIAEAEGDPEERLPQPRGPLCRLPLHPPHVHHEPLQGQHFPQDGPNPGPPQRHPAHDGRLHARQSGGADRCDSEAEGAQG